MYQYTHFTTRIIVSLHGFKPPSLELLPTPALQTKALHLILGPSAQGRESWAGRVSNSTG